MMINVPDSLDKSQAVQELQAVKVLNQRKTKTAPPHADLHADTPMHLYDINSTIPFHILQTSQVRLEPFVVGSIMLLSSVLLIDTSLSSISVA